MLLIIEISLADLKQ